MTRVITVIVTAIAVLVSGLAIAVPAQATKGDNRACVTNKEFRAIKKGMPKAKAVRILDGKGTQVTKRVRQYNECGQPAKKVRVKYAKAFANPRNRVASKQIITVNPWQARVNRPGPDIDCADIPARWRPVRISGPDYHDLDRDNDGWACDI